MDTIVTYEKLLEICEMLKEENVSDNKSNVLLDENLCNKMHYLKKKKLLLVLFKTFNSAKYLYEFPLENNIKISRNYGEFNRRGSLTHKSKIERLVDSKIDTQIFVTEVYYSLLRLNTKLSYRELIYLINTFIKYKSEEKTSEELQISKSYLQKIKKSCIIKMWSELGKYCIEE